VGYKKLASLGILLAFWGLGCGGLFFAEPTPPQNKTMSNLNAALRGEANASYRYELFAKKADEEGYTQVAKLFKAISMSESIHRNNHKAALLSLGGMPEVINFAKVSVQSTRQNLEGPVQGEAFEKDVLYPDFIRQAKKDNALIAVKSFEYAKNSEIQHDKLFENALKNLGHNKVVDYCISPVSGATIEIPVKQSCPRETVQTRTFLRVR